METMIDKDDVEIRRHLKRFVRARLDELEMTAADLGRATGVNHAQIHRVLNGLHTPSMSFARKLARALECDPNSLYGVASLIES
jgi:transcriptional regulator with XRE-family HTH domain